MEIVEKIVYQAGSYRNKIGKLKELLQQQHIPDINFESKDRGFTALYKCCYYGHDQLVSILLNEKGIDVNKVCENDYTPFYKASCGKLDLVRSLIKDARVDVEKVNFLGWSPFMVACWQSQMDIAKFLLSYGRTVDYNRRSTKSWPYSGGFAAGSNVIDFENDQNSRDSIGEKRR